MCMEDVRMGREVRSGQIRVPISAASVGVVANSPSRYCLVLCPPSTGTMTLSILPEAVANEGIVLAAGNAPVIFTVDDHGDLATRAWSAIHHTGAAVFTAIEGHLGRV